MDLFKKKKETEPTLQEIEQQFNQLQFEAGSFSYLIEIKTQEINIYNDELNKRLEKMKKLAQKGNVLRGKIKTELEETIRKGEKVETTLN